jgi:hypothetical protein
MRVKVIIIRVRCSRSLSPKHTTERRHNANAGLSTVTLRFVANEHAAICFTLFRPGSVQFWPAEI